MKLSENATVAKARTIYGKRLKHNNYIELASKKKVSEAAEYLKKNTYFSEALSNVDTSSIHRGYLESILHKAYYDKYEKLCKFQHLDEKPFFTFLLVRSEVRELFKALLSLNNESRDVYIESMHSFFVKKSRINLIELAKASDFESFLKVIRHTPYYDVLKGVTPDSEGRVPYVKCEILLRTYYLKWLQENALKSAHGRYRKELVEQINVQIDIINIINGYRLKTFFNADADVLEQYMLPFYGRLSKEKHYQLLNAQTSEEFIRILMNTSYGRQMDQLSENMESEQFEKETVKIRYAMARRALMFSEDAAVSLYSLMYLQEVELDNIINIIEGIRYNKSISYMENLIIL